MEAFFKELNEVDNLPQAELIRLNELPIGKLFEKEDGVINNEKCGRGIRFSFDLDELSKFVYIPKRYAAKWSNTRIDETNTAIGAGYPPGFKYMGIRGAYFLMSFETLFHGMCNTSYNSN